MKIIQPDGTEWAATLLARPSEVPMVDDTMQLRSKGTIMFRVRCDYTPAAGDILSDGVTDFQINVRYDADGDHLLYVRAITTPIV